MARHKAAPRVVTPCTRTAHRGQRTAHRAPRSEQVLQQVVGEAGDGSDAAHEASDQALRPVLTGPSVRCVRGFAIEMNTHRGTRRTWMFLYDGTGRPPLVAG